MRISNAYGIRPLRIGAAWVGLRSAGPALVPDSNRRLTFGGEPGATIAAGALIVSDPVELAFAPLSDLAVSVHLPDDLPASFGITGRYARQTNYVSPPGDFATKGEIGMPVGRLTDDWYFACWHRRRCTARNGRRGRGRRLADRRQYLHPRRPSQLALAVGPPAAWPGRADGRWRS